MSALPSGFLLSPGFQSNYEDNVTLAFLVRGDADLQLQVRVVDVRPRDVLQIGSGEVFGQMVIETYDGVTIFNNGDVVISISDPSCWITFTPTDDGNTGRGFVLNFM